MKKLSAILLIAALAIALFLPVFAAGNGPVITLQPQNRQFPEDAVAIYTVKAEGDNLHAYWYLKWNGVEYDLSKVGGSNPTQPWEGYAGESYGPRQNGNEFMYVFEGIGKELNDAEIWCVIEDGHNDVTSAKARITVNDAGTGLSPEIVSIPVTVTAEKGKEAEIRCVARLVDETKQLMFIWYSADSADAPLETIRALPENETDSFLFPDTSEIGSRYYLCGVFHTVDGTNPVGPGAYSSIVTVTVTAPKEPAGPGTDEPATDEPVTGEPVTGEVKTGEEKPAPSGKAPEKDAEEDGVRTASFPWWGTVILAVVSAGVGVAVAILIVKKKK